MRLVARAKRRARAAGLPFDLRWEQVAPRLLAGRCELTGIPFRSVRRSWRTNPYAPSLDRIDAAHGYHPANIRVVLWAVNAARGEWGDDVFHEIATAYAGRQA